MRKPVRRLATCGTLTFKQSIGDAHKPLAKNEPYGLEMPLGYVEIFDFLRSKMRKPVRRMASVQLDLTKLYEGRKLNFPSGFFYLAKNLKFKL